MYGTQPTPPVYCSGHIRYLNFPMTAPGQHLSKHETGSASNCCKFQVYADVRFHLRRIALQKAMLQNWCESIVLLNCLKYRKVREFEMAQK